MHTTKKIILFLLCVILLSCQRLNNPLTKLSYEQINDVLIDVTMQTGRDETCLDFFAGETFAIRLSKQALLELTRDCNDYAAKAAAIFTKKYGKRIALADVKDPSIWKHFLSAEKKK